MARPDSGIYAIVDLDRLSPLVLQPEQRDQDAAAAQVVAYVEAAAAAGAVAVQIRAKSVPPSSLWLRGLCWRLLETRPAGPWLVVNDHLEAARPFAGQARLGLHLGQDDTSALTARHQLGESALIGLSTHNLVQVESALALPVDYLGFGPVRATTGKARPGATTGFEALARAVAAAEPRPVVAIGGLEAADVAAVRAAGATAMAVIGAWLGPSDAPREPEAAGQALARLVAAWGAKP